MMYGFWDMECDRYFFVILVYFLPFYPSNNSKIKILKKWKKKPEDIVILHLCNINENHMMFLR